MGKKEREEAYVEEAYVRQVLSCFISTPKTIPLANQNDSPGQPKWSLRAATCVRYNYYVQLVATKRDWMRVPNVKFWSTAERGGWKLVVNKAVTIILSLIIALLLTTLTPYT